MPNPQKKSESEPFAARAIYSDVYPLDEFYKQRGEPLPAIGHVEPGEIPEPYKSMLVHEGDMTSRLEAFHHDTVHIKLFARHTHENEYFREVILVLDGVEKPVEFGAIKIITTSKPT